MSWLIPVLDDRMRMRVLTPQEWATLKNIQGAADQLPLEWSGAIEEVRGAISGGNYPLGDAGMVPSGLVNDVIAIARWRLLTGFPLLQKLQTKERKDSFDGAQERLSKIMAQDYGVESPTPGREPSTGSWNSENKLIMRTHPVPTAPTQFQSTDGNGPPYANPDESDV